MIVPELRDQRGADDALRRARGAVLRHRRDHRAPPRREGRRPVGHRDRHRRAHGGGVRASGHPTPRPSWCSTARAAARAPAGSRSTRCGCAASSPIRRCCSAPPGQSLSIRQDSYDRTSYMPGVAARDQDHRHEAGPHLRSRRAPRHLGGRGVGGRRVARAGARGHVRVHRTRRDRQDHGRGRGARVRVSPGPPSTGCSPVGATSSSARRSRWEMARFFAHLGTELGPTPDFETFLERALPLAREQVLAHAVLQKVLETEPERLMPLITVEQHHVISYIAAYFLPLLERDRDAGLLRARGRAGELRRVRRPDGAVAHRLAGPPRPRGPRRGPPPRPPASSSAGCCHREPRAAVLLTMRQKLVYCLRHDRPRGLDTGRPSELAQARGRAARPVDALLACIARFGLAKTTLDDVAREAGLLARHALPLLRRQARRSCGAPSPSSSSGSRAPRSTAAHERVDVRRRGGRARRHRRARARRITARCSSCSRTSPSDPRPARVRSRRPRPRPRRRRARTRVRRWLRDDDAHARRRLDRPCPPVLRLDARTHRSISPTPSRRATSSRSSSIPGSAPTSRTGAHDGRPHLEIIGRADVERPRSDPRDHQHRRRRDRRTRCTPNADAIFTWDYERSRPALGKLYEKAKTSQWNANDLPWDIEVDQEKVVGREPEPERVQPRRTTSPDTPFEKWGDKEWIRVRRRVAELDAVAVHARRAGRADLHRADRRDRAVDRRQVLRGDAGDGRSPPRRGVRALPRHQAVGALPDQRAPRDAARRHHRRHPVGHDLPRHADHGRGPRARRVRVPAPDDHRAAAQEAAPLRDERRSAPRRVRRALAAGVLPAALATPRSASARSSRSRPPSACATASSSRRRGSAWAST